MKKIIKKTAFFLSIILSLGTLAQSYTISGSGFATVTGCSGNLFDSGGNSNYLNNSNGGITILPTNPNEKVILIFNTFSVFTDTQDRISIFDGLSTTSSSLIGNYVTTNPQTITASNLTGALTIYFYSNGSQNDVGFQASISCISSLSGVPVYQIPQSDNITIAGCDGKITDHSIFGNYSGNINGSITILPSIANTKASLVFSSYQLASSDYLYFYNGVNVLETSMGRYSSTFTPTTITSYNQNGSLTMKFISSSSLPKALGFDAKLSCVSDSKIYPVPYRGGRTITGCSGTITDQNIFNNYIDDTNGSLTILPTASGLNIKLSFTEFSITGGFSDRLNVYDGNSINSSSIGSYAYGNIIGPFAATRGALTIEHKNFSYDVNATGFRATLSCTPKCPTLSSLPTFSYKEYYCYDEISSISPVITINSNFTGYFDVDLPNFLAFSNSITGEINLPLTKKNQTYRFKYIFPSTTGCGSISSDPQDVTLTYQSPLTTLNYGSYGQSPIKNEFCSNNYGNYYVIGNSNSFSNNYSTPKRFDVFPSENLILNQSNGSISSTIAGIEGPRTVQFSFTVPGCSAKTLSQTINLIGVYTTPSTLTYPSVEELGGIKGASYCRTGGSIKPKEDFSKCCTFRASYLSNNALNTLTGEINLLYGSNSNLFYYISAYGKCDNTYLNVAIPSVDRVETPDYERFDTICSGDDFPFLLQSQGTFAISWQYKVKDTWFDKTNIQNRIPHGITSEFREKSIYANCPPRYSSSAKLLVKPYAEGCSEVLPIGWNNVKSSFLNPTFVWDYISTNHSFNFELSKDSAFSSSGLILQLLNAFQHPINYGYSYSYNYLLTPNKIPLELNKKYFWRITPLKGGIVDGIFSSISYINSFITSENSIINGIDENSNLSKSLIIYPNPSSDVFTITTEIDILSQYDVYSIFGKHIESGTFQKEKQIALYSKGVYIIEIIQKDKRYRQKIVVQ